MTTANRTASRAPANREPANQAPANRTPAVPEFAEDTRPNGPVAAAYLAAGIGAFMMGVMTTLSEASASISNGLRWSKPVGPLSGKVGVTLIIYLLSWVILHFALRGKNVKLANFMSISLVLLVLGFLGTFPPFFALFAAE
jgi:hypothetical protein